MIIYTIKTVKLSIRNECWNCYHDCKGLDSTPTQRTTARKIEKVDLKNILEFDQIQRIKQDDKKIYQNNLAYRQFWPNLCQSDFYSAYQGFGQA